MVGSGDHPRTASGTEVPTEDAATAKWMLVVQPRAMEPRWAESVVARPANESVIRTHLKCVFWHADSLRRPIYWREGTRHWVVEFDSHQQCHEAWTNASLYNVQKVVNRAWIESPKEGLRQELIESAEWPTDEDMAEVDMPLHVDFPVLRQVLQSESKQAPPIVWMDG